MQIEDSEFKVFVVPVGVALQGSDLTVDRLSFSTNKPHIVLNGSAVGSFMGWCGDSFLKDVSC